MSEEFLIQCPGCDTLYDDLQDACPYCGEPRPDLADDAFVDDSLTAVDHTRYATDYRQYTTPQDVYAGYSHEDELYDEQDEADLYHEQLTYDYGEPQQAYSPYDDEPQPLAQPAVVEVPAPRHFTWRRTIVGCLVMLVCLALLYGGVGLLAVREGLTERALNIQSESQDHYQKGQDHLANDSIDLAIAEFQMAISINPNFLEARQALREAQKIAQEQPTPTSETRSAAAAERLAEAEVQIDREEWAEAAETLSQVHDLDPDYQAEQVSDLIYKANYELGLQLIVPSKLEEAVAAFERALAERPDDPETSQEHTKASLYLAGMAATEAGQNLEAVEQFRQLYEQDESYLDVNRRLRQAYELAGDELAETDDWCLAEIQYTAANSLRFSEPLQAKLEESTARCEQETLAEEASPTPRATPVTAKEVVAAAANSTSTRPTSPTATPTASAAAPPPPENRPSSGNGSILFSAFNQNELRWEIISVPAGGGSPKVLVTNGTMPALSPNGQMLLYHSELIDSEGLHIFDLTTGQDRRVTLRKRHILPRWGGSNAAFILVAQEPGTGRWQVQQGFADGKSEPINLLDGRTPDWSPDGSLIAYQGTDPRGNEPGIYVIPFTGGNLKRLTDHESDRLPIFSPNGSELAYMSTRSGNWDIYIINTTGGKPRQLTTNPSNDGLPAWSPDGSQIAYISDAGGSWSIYTIKAGGGAPTRVGPWDNMHPDWLLAQIWWIR